MEEAEARLVPQSSDLVAVGLRYERIGSFDRALALYRAVAEEAPDGMSRAEALRRQSDVFRRQADWRRAMAAARASGEVAKACGSAEQFAEALNAEGAVQLACGGADLGVSCFEAVLRTAADRRIRGLALQNLGCVATVRRDAEAARLLFRESYRAFTRADYAHGAAIAVANDGAVAVIAGEFELAERICERAIRLARRTDDLTLEATARRNYAEALIAQRKDLDVAELRLVAALGFFTGTGNARRVISCLQLVGDLYVARDQPGRAIRPYRRAWLLAREIGQPQQRRFAAAKLAALGYSVRDPEPTAMDPIDDLPLHH
ncbi:MAG: hypothetical protein ACODAE_10725 [Gemmatimonadota bacterium]